MFKKQNLTEKKQIKIKDKASSRWNNKKKIKGKVEHLKENQRKRVELNSGIYRKNLIEEQK